MCAYKYNLHSNTMQVYKFTPSHLIIQSQKNTHTLRNEVTFFVIVVSLMVFVSLGYLFYFSFPLTT